MQMIPTRPVRAQAFGVILSDQQVVLTLRQLAGGLFINVEVNNVEIVGLVVCQDLNRIVRDAYLGFVGDLMFYDASGGRANPYYAELGSRFQLLYLNSDELTAFES